MSAADSKIISSAALRLNEVERAARAVALILNKGDWVSLCGGLGAGKTAFVRAAIKYMVGAGETIPSPSFTLLQEYVSAQKGAVQHADFYRLNTADEILELGLPVSLADNISFIEWAERGAGLLPPPRFIISLDFVEGDDEARGVRIEANKNDLADYNAALARQEEIDDFLNKNHFTNNRHLIAGDASGRRYERVLKRGESKDNKTIILMDWNPHNCHDNGGQKYIAAARLAPDIDALLKINALLAAHINAPDIIAAEQKAGLLLQEDFGDNTLGSTPPARRAPIYLEAVESLLALHRQSAPATLPPFDGELWAAEADQFIQYYLPYKGVEISAAAKKQWHEFWQQTGDEIFNAEGEARIILRDYHSPNLHWLKDGQARGRLGVIDFQDALRGTPAYDLASLLQDARIDVAPAIQAHWLEHYLERSFGANNAARTEREAFLRAYYLCAAQRNFKILGIFARLAVRDNKPAYLKHIPRIKDYLAQTLLNKELAAINNWLTSNLDGGL